MNKWQHPFPKSTITSRYGETARRTSPHRGLDYAPKSKSIIPAITDAVVTNIFYSNCLGWICEIRSEQHGIYIGHSHLYCNKHNTVNCDGSDHEDGSTCMKNLKVGDLVTQGQPVGRVGNSGTCSRGSHLHLTFSKKPDPRYAKTFDPEKFIDQKISKQIKREAEDGKTQDTSRREKPDDSRQKKVSTQKTPSLGSMMGRFWVIWNRRR